MFLYLTFVSMCQNVIDEFKSRVKFAPSTSPPSLLFSSPLLLTPLLSFLFSSPFHLSPPLSLPSPLFYFLPFFLLSSSSFPSSTVLFSLFFSFFHFSSPLACWFIALKMNLMRIQIQINAFKIMDDGKWQTTERGGKNTLMRQAKHDKN